MNCKGKNHQRVIEMIGLQVKAYAALTISNNILTFWHQVTYENVIRTWVEHRLL